MGSKESSRQRNINVLQYRELLLGILYTAVYEVPGYSISQLECIFIFNNIIYHNISRIYWTGSSHSGAEKYPRKGTNKPKVIHINSQAWLLEYTGDS